AFLVRSYATVPSSGLYTLNFMGRRACSVKPPPRMPIGVATKRPDLIVLMLRSHPSVAPATSGQYLLACPAQKLVNGAAADLPSFRSQLAMSLGSRGKMPA